MDGSDLYFWATMNGQIVAMDEERFWTRRTNADMEEHNWNGKWFDPAFQQFVDKELIPRTPNWNHPLIPVNIAILQSPDW